MPQPTPYSGQLDEPYITPMNDPYPGYVVSIPKPNEPSRYLRRRFFGRGSLSGYTQRAIAWRDELHLRLYGVPPPGRVFHQQQRTSKTGVPGVRLVRKQVKNRYGREYEVVCYLAEVWLVPGQDGKRPRGSRSKLFSIAKYGEDTALQLARDWRGWAQARLERGEPLEGWQSPL